MKIPSPPEGLSPDAQRWWNALHTEFEINDAAGRLLVETAVRSYDRMTEARMEVAKKGALVKDRFGQPRANPMLNVERDARIALLTSLRALKLDIEPPTGR